MTTYLATILLFRIVKLGRNSGFLDLKVGRTNGRREESCGLVGHNASRRRKHVLLPSYINEHYPGITAGVSAYDEKAHLDRVSLCPSMAPMTSRARRRHGSMPAYLRCSQRLNPPRRSLLLLLQDARLARISAHVGSGKAFTSPRRNSHADLSVRDDGRPVEMTFRANCRAARC